VTTITSSSDNINRPICKKVVCVGGKLPAFVVVLEEPFVKELAIDQGCWLEQIAMSDGILLRVSHVSKRAATENNGINPGAQDDYEGC
jgi:hypothetical protein